MFSAYILSFLAASSILIYGSPLSSVALVPRDCSAEVAAFNVARSVRRGLNTRSLWWDIQNQTCILSPETSMDNYVPGVSLRSDITGGQQGLAFTLDIGVMDVTTCQPLPNVNVEVWSTNAMGSYGDFLRGAMTSEANGIAEFQTIFPGWASDSANHFNVAVHTSSGLTSSLAHVGKLYFTDKWTTIIGATSPYNQNQNTRIMDLQDANYQSAMSKGYSPIVSITSIQDDWPEGIVGIVTVGVNPHRS